MNWLAALGIEMPLILGGRSFGAKPFGEKNMLKFYRLMSLFFSLLIALPTLGLSLHSADERMPNGDALQYLQYRLPEVLQSLPLNLQIEITESGGPCGQPKNFQDRWGTSPWRAQTMEISLGLNESHQLALAIQCGLWKILLRKKGFFLSKKLFNFFGYDLSFGGYSSFIQGEAEVENTRQIEDAVALKLAQLSMEDERLCNKAGVLLISDQNTEIEYTQRCAVPALEFGKLDSSQEYFVPNRFSQVLQFNYLMAGVGKGIAEAFGHAMLEMKVCWVDVLPCPESETKALVFSYNVDKKAGTRFADGFGWTLGSKLFLQEREVFDQSYGRDSQNLYSLPLKLKNHEKIKLYLVLADFWNEFYSHGDTYRGTWNHLFNNCVSHLWRTLTVALDSQRSMFEKKTPPTTPSQLYYRLKKM